MTAPFDFYKASLELWGKLTKDVQSSSQQWLEQAAKAANEDLAHTNQRLQQYVQEQNWVALATLPQEAAWRSSQHQLQVWQQTVQEALQQQPEVTQSLQNAMAGWQQDAFKSWSQLLSGVGNPAAFLQAGSICRPTSS